MTAFAFTNGWSLLAYVALLALALAVGCVIGWCLRGKQAPHAAGSAKWALHAKVSEQLRTIARLRQQAMADVELICDLRELNDRLINERDALLGAREF